MPVCSDCANEGECTGLCRPMERWTKAQVVAYARSLERGMREMGDECRLLRYKARVADVLLELAERGGLGEMD